MKSKAKTIGSQKTNLHQFFSKADKIAKPVAVRDEGAVSLTRASLPILKELKRTQPNSPSVVPMDLEVAEEEVPSPKPSGRTRQPTPKTSKPKYPIGTKVEKHFDGHGLFQGIVTSIDGELYEVTYSDGDVEEYSDNEMDMIVIKNTVPKPKVGTGKDCRPKNQQSLTKQAPSKKPRVIPDAIDDGSDESMADESESSMEDEYPSSDDESEGVFVVSRPSQSRPSSSRISLVDDDEISISLESKEDGPGRSSRRTKKSAVPAVAKKTAASWGFLNGKGQSKPPVTKRLSTPKPNNTRNSTPSEGVRKVVKACYTAGDDLPIISHPQSMFDDMVTNKLTNHGKDVKLLIPMLKKLHRRPLKVATMCSGTESPILALDMLTKSLEDFVHGHMTDAMKDLGIQPDEMIQIEHVFSCEIEPFKQAYIERNFQPPLLFRDIRELGSDQAYTAYGSLANVPNTPGCVDMLIAGTSCVDYSNLNNEKKTIHQKGESGQTWRGLIDWIRKAQPPIVIIENVKSAPWEAKVKIFEKELGYHAVFTFVDTKQFYIPHTRQRGYLFAVKKTKGAKSSDKGQEVVAQWKEMLKNLQRPASAALDAFMLPNDDPRVLRGRARLSASNGSDSSEQRVDWTRCETRHQFARISEELGDKRPLTGWSDSGNTSMPSFGWNEWANAQVHRIHDLMDINTLRLAVDYIDCTYKTMVWNLSQNVDRETMGKLGLCQCLTPTGVPYVTNRGGPLVGEELLLLQGIPADDLLLTKESEDNLKDLAGNAMSTTVVGACMLSALLLGHYAIVEGTREEAQSVVPSLVPRALAPATDDIQISREMGTYESIPLCLGPQGKQTDAESGTSQLKSLLQEASSSSRKCVSEGHDKALPPSAILKCRECGQTSSVEYATPPRKYEEHEFEPISAKQRIEPAAFRTKLLNLLPMRLEIHDLNAASLESPEVDEILWDSWQGALLMATCSSLSSSEETEDPPIAIEYRFARLIRSHIWTAIYYASNESRLELRISGTEAIWLLFASAPSERGPLRDSLERPVARMRVAPSGTLSLTEGTWELCVPAITEVELSIEGIGNSVESWRSKLGLKAGFENEKRSEALKIKIATEGHDELKTMINGEYKLLPKCGTACGSLHKLLRPSTSKDDGADMFFFLESGRRSVSDDDTFIFSRSKHRTDYGEYRDVVLQVDPSIQFRPDYKGETATSEGRKKSLRALVPGKWVKAIDASLRYVGEACNSGDSTITSPAKGTNLVVKLSKDGWKVCPEVLCCRLPLDTSDRLFLECQKRGRVGQTMEVNLLKSKRIFDDLAYVTSRLTIPAVFSEGWLALDSTDMQRLNVDGDEVACSKCAPSKPSVMWTMVTKNKKQIFIPIEDGREAAVYEQSLKRRPQPWLVRIQPLERTAKASIHSGALQLQIGCNPVSLVHRALGLLPKGSLARLSLNQPEFQKGKHMLDCVFEWRVVPHVDKQSASGSGDFPKLCLTSNKNDKPALQPPDFKDRYPLRPEQLRSLSWMLSQEATTDPFMEEEVTEAVLPSMNWRAEGRTRRPVLVRGGIVADEVGYGKTAITLGLISAAPKVNGPPPDPPENLRLGLIHTNATLVIVPSHLMGQWPREIVKFLGSKKKVCEIKDMNSFNKLSVEEFLNADIVVVNFAVLCGEKYFSRLSRFSGTNTSSLPSGGKTGGRHFDAVYTECLEGVSRRVAKLQENGAGVFEDIEKDAKIHIDRSNNGHVLLDGKKTVYKNTSEEDIKKKDGRKAVAKKEESSNNSVSPADRDPWELRSTKVKRDFRKMKCPPLEMFFWNRVVVDEFHYLAEKADRARVLSLVLGLKSTFRWCLSGTPPHKHFKDVQSLSSLLGIYLGVDDALPGVKATHRGSRLETQKTELEKFSSLLEIRSIQWHERRHQVGQEFLNRFVRQNIAEIDEIKCEEHVVVMDLPPAERAIYLELETFLRSLDMNRKKALKTKKSTIGDREVRMQRVLEESESAEEALLKRCAHFNMSAQSTTALETCDMIIEVRKKQAAECESDLLDYIAAALRQRNRILKRQPDWKGTAQTEKGEVQDTLQNLINDVEKKNSISGGADDEIHQRILDIFVAAKNAVLQNPRMHDSFFADKNCDIDVDDSVGKKRKRPSSAENEESLYQMKLDLREHMHKVRTIGKELAGRMRSLRYFQWVRSFQLKETEIQCMGAGSPQCQCRSPKQTLSPDKVGVLSCCGHVGCLDCLQYHADREECIEPTCQFAVKSTHIVSAADLGADRDHASGGQYGAKLSAIVDKIKLLVRDGDRVIVFVQFQDLKQKVAQALQDRGVKSLQVKGTVQQQIRVLDVLQKETPDKDDPRVLLLTMDDESSSGVNLATCNHAVFVHPLLADTQQQYEAYETQAIGRIRRYGQTKTVHVWRYLARDTIDTEIFKERLGREVDEN